MPPFISRDDIQVINAGNNLNKSKRRSFRKKKERPKTENVKSLNGEQKATDTEDITVPVDIDLIGLPQLCFPGMVEFTLLNENCFIIYLLTHSTAKCVLFGFFLRSSSLSLCISQYKNCVCLCDESSC